MKKTVNSDRSLSEAIGILRSSFAEKKYFVMRLMFGKARTLPQNAIAHVWYKQIADELKDRTSVEIKCECKYNFGLPILLDDPEFEADICGQKVFYFDFVKKFIANLCYSDRLEAMLIIPVTSLMTTEQYNDYLERVRLFYIKVNVVLEYPNDEG